jgi:hypothetical protein
MYSCYEPKITLVSFGNEKHFVTIIVWSKSDYKSKEVVIFFMLGLNSSTILIAKVKGCYTAFSILFQFLAHFFSF